jgi:drug/metabolite transporter (DMT)-like permease
MDWIGLGLASTLLFSLVTVLDRQLLVKYFPVASSMSFLVGFIQFGVAGITLSVVLPVIGVPDSGPAGIALLSGIVWAIGLMSFFKGLQMEEVSRATPVAQTYPIFTSILAVVFLGEVMSPLQWVAVLVVVTGAGLVSFRHIPGVHGFINPKALAILTFGSIMIGTAFVVGKVALDELDVWTVCGFRSIGMGIGLVTLNYRSGTVGQVRAAFKGLAGPRMLIITEGVLAPIALVLLAAAIARGPVSLVSAVAATRPLFVLILASVLSTRVWNIMGEPLDRGTLTLKVASTGLMVGGVVALVLV